MGKLARKSRNQWVFEGTASTRIGTNRCNLSWGHLGFLWGPGGSSSRPLRGLGPFLDERYQPLQFVLIEGPPRVHLGASCGLLGRV